MLYLDMGTLGDKPGHEDGDLITGLCGALVRREEGRTCKTGGELKRHKEYPLSRYQPCSLKFSLSGFQNYER